jgi:hypothetical protein
MTAHSRWPISSIPFVSCSDRCPVNPLSPSPPSRLACTGPRPFSVVKSVLLSLCYHDWKKCNVSYCICCAPTVGNVLDFLRQLLQPLALCLPFIYMMNFLIVLALTLSMILRFQFRPWPTYLVAFRLDWKVLPGVCHSEIMTVFPLSLFLPTSPKGFAIFRPPARPLACLVSYPAMPYAPTTT